MAKVSKLHYQLLSSSPRNIRDVWFGPEQEDETKLRVTIRCMHIGVGESDIPEIAKLSLTEEDMDTLIEAIRAARAAHKAMLAAASRKGPEKPERVANNVQPIPRNPLNVESDYRDPTPAAGGAIL